MLPAKGVGAVSSDPRSKYRYSSFHVQFGGSQYENLPSMPPPTENPTLVLEAPNGTAWEKNGEFPLGPVFS